MCQYSRNRLGGGGRMIKKYVKKQGAPFDAIQWNGNNEKDVIKFIDIHRVILYTSNIFVLYGALHQPICAEIGDYIIIINGNASIIKQNKFEEEYKEL